MPQEQEKESNRDSEESVRHAEWVREHPSMGESAFPEYPDELSRRGSSRGAVPNGNPWRPVEADEKPGRSESEAEVAAPSSRTETDLSRADTEPRGYVTPPEPVSAERTHRPAVVLAENEADDRLGRDIGDVLASSKALEGTHLLVEVVDGDVYLHGTVADQAVRSEVEQLSSSVRGAKRIFNELDVRH
jgi:hypothetical protein